MDVLILVASFPVIYFLVYLYKLDRVEKEPLSILLLTIFGGILAAITSIGLEILADDIIIELFYSDYLLYQLASAFLGVALIEEGTKYFFLNAFTWRSRHFNCSFDGLVYAVFVSLGFALAENIMYVKAGGLTTGVLRAFSSIEGHMAFSIFYGYYYSKARMVANQGYYLQAKVYKFTGLLLAILSHGLYDFCLFMRNDFLMTIWFGLLMIFYVMIFHLTKKQAANDHYI